VASARADSSALSSTLATVVPDFTNPKFGDCVATPFQAALEGYFSNGGDLKAILTDVSTQADACLVK
jgi:hypothetical protein